MRTSCYYIFAAAAALTVGAMVLLSGALTLTAAVLFVAGWVVAFGDQPDPLTKRYPWLTEPMQDTCAADADYRRLYMLGRVSTEDYIKAVETGKLPTAIERYTDWMPQGLPAPSRKARPSFEDEVEAEQIEILGRRWDPEKRQMLDALTKPGGYVILDAGEQIIPKEAK